MRISVFKIRRGYKLTHRGLPCLLAGLLALTTQPVCGEPTTHPNRPVELPQLEELVARWVNLRSTLAAEATDWQVQKRQWEQEIDLLLRESEALRKDIDEGTDIATSVERERAAVLAKTEQLNAEFALLDKVLEQAEQALQDWHTRIPESLLPALATNFRNLPATREQAQRIPLTKRAQNVAALYSGIENLLHGIHTTRETILPRTGPRRHADVLYLGLAQAFAVAPSNDWAAIGTPSKQGWRWVVRTEHAQAIRSVLDILNRRQPAAMIQLPLSLGNENEDDQP